ncbi:MAG: hypothetical protein IJ802_00110 [Kiritimatiellae bacterium]|nr:hypothetical protein [Kiritimatiellia bacterium]
MKRYGVYMAAVAAAMMAAGCATQKGSEGKTLARIGDPYFANVDSKANVYARQAQTGVLKIAVMPLKASTELIGSSVSDMVVTELLRTQKYSLVERGQMKNVLNETELAMAGLSEAQAVEAAKMLGAEAVVIGTVDEYSTQAKGGATFAVAGLSIRLIDCSNGRVVWSADLAKMAQKAETPLAAHARDVVHELVSGLYQNLTGQAGGLPPPPPTGLAIGEMGLREAVLTWDKTPFAATYRIDRAVDEEGPFVPVGNASAQSGTFRDTKGLKDATVYYYRVVGVGRSGTASDPSQTLETMTAPPPDAPGAPEVTGVSSRCVMLAWGASKSDGVNAYRVERTADGVTWKNAGTARTAEFRDGGRAGCDLGDSATYIYRIVAVNRVGAESEPSQTVQAVTPPPPGKTEGFAAETDEVRCVPLAWTALDEADVAGYEIERAAKTGAFAKIATVKGKDKAEYKDANLADGAEFRYRVRAFTEPGAKGEWSDETAAATKPLPKVPDGLAATKDEPGRVAVRWNANEEEFVTGYKLEAKGTGGFARWKTIASTPQCEGTDAGLAPGEVKQYRVKAVDRYGRESAWSMQAQGCARPLPSAPGNVRASGRKIAWSAVKDASEYKIYKKKFVGTDFIMAVKNTEAELPPEIEGGIDVVVTTIDKCNLESKASEKVRVGQ